MIVLVAGGLAALSVVIATWGFLHHSRAVIILGFAGLAIVAAYFVLGISVLMP